MPATTKKLNRVAPFKADRPYGTTPLVYSLLSYTSLNRCCF